MSEASVDPKQVLTQALKLVVDTIGMPYDVATKGALGAFGRQGLAEAGHFLGQAFPDNFSAPQLGGIGQPTPGMVDRGMEATIEPVMEQAQELEIDLEP